MHYSTLDGTALAEESRRFWLNWPDYLEAESGDDEPLARYREIGCMVMKTAGNDHMARHAAHCQALGIAVEHWDAAAIRARLPLLDLRR